MSKINLVIAEEDSDYLNGLVRFIANNFEATFKITCFTKREFLKKYIDSGRGMDILLIKPEIYYEEIKNNNVKSIIILSDNKESNCHGYPAIKKYQSGQRLCEEILNIYKSENNEKLEEDKDEKCSIVTIYSPVGGVGKSTIAISLAMRLKEIRKKVLYLNLEDLQSTEAYFNCNTNKNMSDLLYFVKERDNDFKGEVQEILMEDTGTGINYFAPVDSALDVEGLVQEDMKFMLNEMSSSKLFDYIIIDLSSKFNSSYKMLLELSSRVIVPIVEGKLVQIKLENFISQMGNIDNMFFVQNKFKESNEFTIPEVLIKEKRPIIQALYYDPFLKNINNAKEIKSKANAFYKGISDLVIKLL